MRVIKHLEAEIEKQAEAKDRARAYGDGPGFIAAQSALVISQHVIVEERGPAEADAEEVANLPFGLIEELIAALHEKLGDLTAAINSPERLQEMSDQLDAQITANRTAWAEKQLQIMAFQAERDDPKNQEAARRAQHAMEVEEKQRATEGSRVQLPKVTPVSVAYGARGRVGAE